MRRRVLFLIRTYLWTMVIFIVAKVVFMVANHEGHAFGLGDVGDVIAHGLTLDLSTALYVMIVPMVVCGISVWEGEGDRRQETGDRRQESGVRRQESGVRRQESGDRRNFHRFAQIILRGYFLIVAMEFAMAFVADTSLYKFWGFKLDASCLQYLETPTEAMASVSGWYLLIRLVVFIMIAGIISFGYLAGLKETGVRSQESGDRSQETGDRSQETGVRSQETGVRSKESGDRRQESGDKETRRPTILHKTSETIFYLVCIPLMVIGIRGGLNESTTNIGQVYYSQNQFLNHAAVNPVFSFLSSFEKTANNIEDYHFFSDEECAQLMKGIYGKETGGRREGRRREGVRREGVRSQESGDISSDTLLNTNRPNIVIVLMESAGDIFRDVMPNLQQLRKEGIDFTNCYGNTWRTDRGTLCTYSGYPSFPTSSVMKMPKKTKHLPSIASVLRQEGYHTHYLYGGDINFTNMRSYLISTGWEQLTWLDDFTMEERHSANWGVRDDITFDTLYQMIRRQESGVRSQETGDRRQERFLIGFSTLSSHEPWDVPIKKYDQEELNAFYYLDQCIGDFISKLKKTPQWENLLVIFLPDHSIDFGEYTETHPLRNKIPMVWVGGAVRAPREVKQFCNQTDLAATLLAQLQLSHEAFRWSRDVLSTSYQYPFAVHNYNNGFSLTDSTGFIVYDLGASRLIKAESSQSQRLERMGKAILQATTEDLKALGRREGRREGVRSKESGVRRQE